MFPRQGCASHMSTNKNIPSEASEEPSDTVIHFYFYFFFIHKRALLSASQRQCSSVECSKNMLSEAFWTPNIASSQFDEYSQLGSRRNVRPVKNQLGSPSTSNLVREQTFAQLRTGLRKGDGGCRAALHSVISSTLSSLFLNS